MASKKIQGITIELDADTSKMAASLKKVDKEISSTQISLKSVNKLLKLDPTNTELLQQKQKLLTNAINDTKDKLNTEKEMLESIKGNPDTEEQQAALTREIEKTSQSLKSLEDQYKDFGSVGSQQLKAVGQSVSNVGTKVSSAGESLTKNVTTPIVAVGVAAQAAFNEVDAGEDAIIKKTGASGDSLKSMQDIMSNIATEIPTDFETAGNAVGEVNTKFGSTGDELHDLTTQFLQFAELNNTDVTTSVDNVSAVLNSFGMQSSDAGGMLDVLNTVSEKTGINVDTLSTDLSNNAAQLQSMGLNATQSAQFLGQVEMSGLDTSTAMAGMKKAMANATSSGQTLDEALKGFSTTMSGNKSDTEKLQAAYDLFGNKAGAAIYNAVSNGKMSLDDFSSNMSDFSGSVSNAFGETVDPVDKFKTTLNALKEVGAEVSNSLMTVLEPVLVSVGNAFKSLKDWWTSLSPEAQKLITKILMIAAAVGPIVLIIGKLITGIGSVISAIGMISGVMSVLNVSLLPIIAIIAGIAAAIAAVILIVQNWGSISQWFGGVWNTICTTVQNLAQGLSDFFTGIWNTISTTITNVWNGILGFFQGIWNSIMGVFSDVGSWFGGIFQGAWNGITSAWGNVGSFFGGVIDNIASFFTGLPGKALQWGTDMINGFINGIKNMIGNVGKAVSNVANKVKNFLHFSKPDEGPLRDYETWMPDFMSGIANGINKNAYKVSDAMRGLTSDMAVSATINGSTGVSTGATNNSTVINVYGAEGQDVSKLADIVESKINKNVARRNEVFG